MEVLHKRPQIIGLNFNLCVLGFSSRTKNDIYMDDEIDFPDNDNLLRKRLPMILPDDEGIMSGLINFSTLPKTLPILALRDNVLFPRVAIPVLIGREKTHRLLSYIEDAPNKHVLVVAQKDADVEDPVSKDLVETGTVAEVVRIMQIDDELTTIILQGKRLIKLGRFTQHDPFMRAYFEEVPETKPRKSDEEYRELGSSILETMVEILRMRGDAPTPFIESLQSLKSTETIVNFASNNFPDTVEDKLGLLLNTNYKQRGFQVHKLLNKIKRQEELRKDILERTHYEMDKQQKEYFLQQQMRMIKKEINDSADDDSAELLERASKKKWSAEVQDSFEKEVKKLQRMPSQSPDYSIQIQYLETLLDLPWNEYTEDSFDINRAKAVLDKDHFGLEKVKERILEHLSILKLKGNMHAPILCLYGPPGVGKTSLGRSIAEALGRKYVRISLGGLHDEAEIRGHRRTYIGAMPGRLIKGFLKAASSNPVFVLDEVDKLGSDYKGDPSSALLEVLDPEQNNTFHDNYLDLDYDLSQTLFIATANNAGEIPDALRDRMEMIEVTGYIQEEKTEIASRHLLPKALKQVGLKPNAIKIAKPTIDEIIEFYTRESGVRELDKRINEIIRKAVKDAAMEKENVEDYFPIKVGKTDLEHYLGQKKYIRDRYDGNKYAGVVTGLAWTSVGGEILLVESAPSPSKSGKMSITGNLGDVMKESAVLALEYLKSHAHLYDIPTEIFDYWNVHIHVPEGAIPKDGPSAGITIVTSLVSTFTQRKVKPNIAMTGEITLRGKVLPVGGIREKILAAKRAGITTIILCKENERDIKEIKPVYLEGLDFIYVSDIKEVIDYALSDETVSHPIDLMARIKEAQKSAQTPNA